MKYTYLSIILLTVFSCTKEELRFSREDILRLGKKEFQNFKFVVPPRIGIKLVDCSKYIPKCLSGYKGKAKLLEFNILEFKNSKEAMMSAKSYNGYYSRNWAFDLVTGEPILERFVKKAFNAKKVKKEFFA